MIETHECRLLRLRIADWVAARPDRTQRVLAARANVSTGTISRWLSGKARPSLGSPEWQRVCSTLEMSPAQLRDLYVAFGLDAAVFLTVGGAS